MIVGIVVVSFTATYFLIRNPHSVAALAGPLTSTISSLGFLADDISREKASKASFPQAGSPAGPVSSEGTFEEPFDPAGLFAAKVLDGETLRLSDGTTIRLIGVKAHETALAFIKGHIEGKNITYEVQAKDEQGRTLAYVRRRSDDLFLNAEIIKRGLGLTDVSVPFEKMQEFSAYEQEARSSKRGIWRDI